MSLECGEAAKLLNISKLEKNLKTLQKLHDEVELLIEGLPFAAPHDSSQAAVGYFSEAAHLCTLTENFIGRLNEHVEERILAFTALVSKVIEWDLENEGAGTQERREFRRLQAEHNKRTRKAIKDMIGQAKS